ncbi:MAG: peptidoglycan bridge formation glycyltransferase FemA/FemB family protein [Spirochaetaceae bacterium]|nr:peptidoglycan bridge formation glycyltransferase FemA/FemB family protein [Spirochaetaceae bacterium]
MCIKRLAPADIDVCAASARFLQSAFWGRFKARFGWDARAFTVEWENAAATPLLVLTRSLAPGCGFAYVPWGPELPPGFSAGTAAAPGRVNDPAVFGGTAIRDGTVASRLLTKLAGLLVPHLSRRIAFIRFDPPWAGAALPPLLEKPLCRAPADIQPPDTVIINLDRSEEELLADMKEKWRYNIRLSAKKGVTVRRAGAEETGVFYALLRETARRDGIAIHAERYYAELFALAAEYGNAAADVRLYIARHEGEDIAAAVTLFRGDEAVYLYGASAGVKRNLMAPYLLQWSAMRDAKAAGCRSYDLFGIPPGDDPAHPMAGLYRFKTGFGGNIIHRWGSWDYPARPLPAALFRAAEGLRKAARTARKRRG